MALNSQNTLIWENLVDEQIKPKHIKNVPKEKVMELWEKLFYDKVDEINSELWIEGYF